MLIVNKTDADTDIEVVLSQYEAISRPFQICQLSEKGIWIVNNQYVVKRIRKPNVANNVCIIIDSLDKTGVHIGKYICTKKRQKYFHGTIGDFIVTEYIKGKQFDINQALNEKDCFGKTIGYCLARLHYSFTLIKTGFFNKANTMLEYDEAISFLNNNEIMIPDNIKNECESFKAIYKCLPRQIIHRDIHLNNIIVGNHNNIYFLDFDSCENNVRIYDIAYFGVTLLDAVYDKTIIKQWWHLYSFFLQGYFNENKLSQVELDSIWKMFVVLQICFIKYYFEIDNNVNNANFRLNKLIYIYNHKSIFMQYNITCLIQD